MGIIKTYPMINHGYFAEEVKRDVRVNKNYNRVEGTKPQTQGISFKKVTYGGINGAYYTATTTRKSGSDGVSNFNVVLYLFEFGLLFVLLICYVWESGGAGRQQRS